ncbi:MAG TPA: hypothetical protein VF414_20330 [Thermoanaerobaculia bacterium]
MKRSTIWLAMTAILLLVAMTALAQPGNGSKRRGSGVDPGTGCLGCVSLDLKKVETVTGTAVAVEGGPGEGVPTLILKDGAVDLEIVIGPYRLWAASGLEVTPGEALTVTYAPCAKTGYLVALSVTEEETDKTVQLRDPKTGQPLGFGRRGPRS